MSEVTDPIAELHARRVITAGALLVLLSSCALTPSGALEQMEKAAREGKAEAFASHFTEESRPFAQALMSLYTSSTPASGPATTPLKYLTDVTVVDTTLQGQSAILKVKPKDGAEARLYFLLEGGEWKLDIRQTENLNAEK